MPADPDRSLERIEIADLLRLAALAADAEAELFRRNPRGSGRDAGRLLGRALCQGAALHYVNGSNGVKDFDVWSFYAQYDDWPFPPRWRYLAARRTASAKALAAKAVVLIDPENRAGEIVWPAATA